MASRVTRSKKGLSNMMTRKIICDTKDDITFHLISEEFDKVSAKVKGKSAASASDPASASAYTISIDYFDNTTQDNTIQKDYVISPPNSSEKTPPSLFCQVDVLHIHKSDNKLKYSLKGIFSLLKSYCIAEGDAAIINNKAFKKDDLEYFLNIIYKCIVFSQYEKANAEKANATNRFNTYAHFLFNIAKKVNLAVGDVEQNKKNRIIELSMPIDIVEETFDMDKFERFINILAAVRSEYERREKELQEKINKFNLLGNKRQRFAEAEPAPKAEEEEEEGAAEEAEAEEEEEKEEEEEPAVEEPVAAPPAVEEPVAAPPAEETPNLPTFIYDLINGSTKFIQQIDKLNDGFAEALEENKTKLLAASADAAADNKTAEYNLIEELIAQKKKLSTNNSTKNDNIIDSQNKIIKLQPTTEDHTKLHSAEIALQKLEAEKRRHEEIAKNLLITVLTDMKEEQIREQLDNDLDEYFAARPLPITTLAQTPVPNKAPAKTASASPNYEKKQQYEQAVLCYNGAYTKQLLDHISGIATISDIDKLKADIFVGLINNLIKDPSIQSFIRYSKLNEMKKYYESYIAYLEKMASLQALNEKNKIKVTAEPTKVKAELTKVKAELTAELAKELKAELTAELAKVEAELVKELKAELTAELVKVEAELVKVTTAELAKVEAELAKALKDRKEELTTYQTELTTPPIVKNKSQEPVIASMNKVITLLTKQQTEKQTEQTKQQTEKLKQVILKTTAVKLIPNRFQITMITNSFKFPILEPAAPYEIYLETVYDILEAIAKSIISDMNFDYSNRAKEYNQYINLKNSYLSAFRTDLINNANCGHKLEAMNMEYYDEPLISELCGSFGNKVCLGKRKTQAGGSKKITLNGKKYKLHVIDGKKYITMDKKQILLSDAKKAASATNAKA